MTRPGRRIWVLVATVSLMALTARLGVWQLDRAQTKLAMQDQLQANARLPALTASALPETAEGIQSSLYRPLQVQGRWLPQATVYLNNRPMQGAVGFWVMTPLRLDDGRVLLVQRGWLPRNTQDRLRIAPYQTIEERVEVRGRLALEPSRLMELGTSGDGVVRQNLSIAEMARQWGTAIEGARGPGEPALTGAASSTGVSGEGFGGHESASGPTTEPMAKAPSAPSSQRSASNAQRLSIEPPGDTNAPAFKASDERSGSPLAQARWLPFVLVQTEPDHALQPKTSLSHAQANPSDSAGLASPAMMALRRDWAMPASDVHKHWGYAFQWFSLCLLLAILYAWFQIIKPRFKARVGRSSAAADGGSRDE